MNGSSSGNRWRPSRRQQAFDWYLTRAMRLLGGVTIGWELGIDKGRNPLTLLVGAMLATSSDVLGLVRGLVMQARAERKSLEELLQEEQLKERDPDL